MRVTAVSRAEAIAADAAELATIGGPNTWLEAVGTTFANGSARLDALVTAMPAATV